MVCNQNCKCCKGACCCGSQCTQELCQDCEDAHGTWAGPGTKCEEEECSQPTGACCGEACAVLSECECLQAGGEYQGDGTTCDPDPCVECSGPCDGENPCPEGCECCNGVCQPTEEPCCQGECEQDGDCGPGCKCCEGVCAPSNAACCCNDGYKFVCVTGYNETRGPSFPCPTITPSASAGALVTLSANVVRGCGVASVEGRWLSATDIDGGPLCFYNYTIISVVSDCSECDGNCWPWDEAPVSPESLLCPCATEKGVEVCLNLLP